MYSFGYSYISKPIFRMRCTLRKLKYHFEFFSLQVVQSLKEKSQSKNYSELGSCPSLNSGRRPLLARNVGSSSNGDTLGEDAAIFGTGQDTGAIEEFVQTAKGRILIARQGDTKNPAIITYHDIGLNYLSNFQVILNRMTVHRIHCYLTHTYIHLHISCCNMLCENVCVLLFH